MSEGNTNAARLSAVVFFFFYAVTQRIPRGISLSCWQWWLAQQLCHYAFLSFPSLMFSSEAHLPVFCGSICLVSYKTQAQDLFLRLIQNKAKVEYAVWMGMNGQRWEQRRKDWEKVLQAAVPAPVESKPLPLRCWRRQLCLHSSDWNSGQSLSWTQPWDNAQFLVAQMPEFKAEIILSSLLSTRLSYLLGHQILSLQQTLSKGLSSSTSSLPRPELHPCSLVRWERNEWLLCLSLVCLFKTKQVFLKTQQKNFIACFIAWKYDQSYQIYSFFR